MSYFTWKENQLTSDCASLEAMASRYEEAAKLMRNMADVGFILKNTRQGKTITHKNPSIFESWGFISEETPYIQLKLIPEE